MLKYERKLATLTAMNSALESENEELREQLAEAAGNDAEEELAELQEEFGRRLGQADKTIASLRVRVLL
jgi:regulator of replication initiation timing